MGLIADILTGQFAQGMGRDFKSVTVVNADGPFEPADNCPAVMLVRGNLPGTVKAVAAIYDLDSGDYRPLRPAASCVGPMMNGAYIETSDSRFSEAVAALGGPPYSPVPLHDRFETPAQYAVLSA